MEAFTDWFGLVHTQTCICLGCPIQWKKTQDWQLQLSWALELNRYLLLVFPTAIPIGFSCQSWYYCPQPRLDWAGRLSELLQLGYSQSQAHFQTFSSYYVWILCGPGQRKRFNLENLQLDKIAILHRIKAEIHMAKIVAVFLRSSTIQKNRDHHNGKCIIGK